jgi:SIR2-like domain
MTDKTWWAGRAAAKENLRLFEAPNTWRRFAGQVDADTKAVAESGCAERLESLLISALNATNVLLLTGSGASFCAKNEEFLSLLRVTDAPSLRDLWEAVRDKVGEIHFDEAIAKIPNGKAIKDIEKLLTQCKLYVALYGAKAGDGKVIAAFVKAAEAAILERVDFIDGDTELAAHEALLRKLARRGVRKPRAKLFTTNYDLCFEYAARKQRFVVIDGFSHAAPPVYDRSHFGLDIVRRDGAKDAPDYFESVFHLYKLHGSLDWRRTSTDIIRSRGTDGEPVLIYPRDSKYQEAFEPPYLDMMAAFQTALREPDTTLFVAGFSFADSHIAQPVLAALESNMSFRLVVSDPAFVEDDQVKGDPVLVSGAGSPSNAFHQRLVRLAQAGDPRVVLLHGRFEDFAVALPDLVAETERERHSARVKALREMPS